MTAQLPELPSKERREELKTFITAFLTDTMHDDESKNGLTADIFRLARGMLAGMEQEPAATVFKSGDSAKVIMIGADLADGYTDLFAQAAPVVSEQPAPVVKPVSLLMVIFHPRMPINWRKYCRILMPKNR